MSGITASASSFVILPSFENLNSPLSMFRFSRETCIFGVPSLYEKTDTVTRVTSNSAVSLNSSLSKLLSNAMGRRTGYTFLILLPLKGEKSQSVDYALEYRVD